MLQSRLKAVMIAESATPPGLVEGIERKEVLFEQWAAQAGVKAPKLQHAFFPDPVVGDLR